MEYVDLYDSRRTKLNLKKERNTLKKGEYRLSTHVWIENEGKLIIQKRAKFKKIFPNLWEQSGGGVIAGESSLEAAKREVKEELGIYVSNEKIAYIGSYTRINDIVDIWLVKTKIKKDELKLQKEEVSDIDEVTFEEFEKMMKNNLVVPTIEPSYQILKNYYENYKKGIMK